MPPMFPARAGMSRQHGDQIPSPIHVPRASGDEPTGEPGVPYITLCSLRERG